MNALRTGHDLIWLLQYNGSSGRFALSQCLHPMERCALQGFRPVVATAFKRCVEALFCRLGTDVPRGIQQREEARERC